MAFCAHWLSTPITAFDDMTLGDLAAWRAEADALAQVGG